MKFKDFLLLEEPIVSPELRKEFTKLGKKFKYSERYKELFGNSDKIEIPVKLPGGYRSKINEKLAGVVDNAISRNAYKNGFLSFSGKKIDWKEGTVTYKTNSGDKKFNIEDLIKKYGVDRATRSSEKYKKEVELYVNMFKNASFRKGPHFDKVKIIISRNPIDVCAMSTNVGWKSCMNQYTGAYNEYTRKDVEHGTLVAWLVDEKDNKIDYPIGRVLIKPYKGAGDDPNKVYLKVSERTYGEFPRIAKQTLEKWIENKQKGVKGVFLINPSLYDDMDKDIVERGVKMPKLRRGDRVEITFDDDRRENEVLNYKGLKGEIISRDRDVSKIFLDNPVKQHYGRGKIREIYVRNIFLKKIGR